MSRKSIDTRSLNTDKMSDFQQWKQINGNDFSLWDYLGGVANIELALAFTKLFLPDLVDHEDRLGHSLLGSIPFWQIGGKGNFLIRDL